MGVCDLFSVLKLTDDNSRVNLVAVGERADL
jgi:hypothetical protein